MSSSGTLRRASRLPEHAQTAGALLSCTSCPAGSRIWCGTLSAASLLSHTPGVPLPVPGALPAQVLWSCSGRCWCSRIYPAVLHHPQRPVAQGTPQPSVFWPLALAHSSCLSRATHCTPQVPLSRLQGVHPWRGHCDIAEAQRSAHARPGRLSQRCTSSLASCATPKPPSTCRHACCQLLTCADDSR